MKTLLSILAVGIGAATAGCASMGAPSSGEPHARDLAAIAAFNQKYLKAINDGDSAALSELTNTDHLMIAPNRVPVAGKQANTQAMEQAFKQFKIDEQWTPLETVVDGNLAYQRGEFTVVATPKGGGTSRSTHGSFLRIYRRLPDGSWQMTRDMFNSDQAPAPPGQ